jgi:hypothetical protein
MNNALITDEQRIVLLANGRESLENPDFDPAPVVKLFTPDAGATWLLTEIDPDDHDRFGLCDLAWGAGNRLGQPGRAGDGARRAGPADRARPVFPRREAVERAYARDARLAGGRCLTWPWERRKALLAFSFSKEINAMSSHHDYIIEITAQHDALKPFAPENGQPALQDRRRGDLHQETAHSSGVASPALPAHRAFGLYARGARYAGLVGAVDAGVGIQPAP